LEMGCGRERERRAGGSDVRYRRKDKRGLGARRKEIILEPKITI
jgi:hypothetical protein